MYVIYVCNVCMYLLMYLLMYLCMYIMYVCNVSLLGDGAAHGEIPQSQDQSHPDSDTYPIIGRYNQETENISGGILL